MDDRMPKGCVSPVSHLTRYPSFAPFQLKRSRKNPSMAPTSIKPIKLQSVAQAKNPVINVVDARNAAPGEGVAP
jgi:hypothetical protein